MKKINKIVCLLTLLASVYANAQFLGAKRLSNTEDGPKGQMMVYGSLDYSKTNTPFGSSSSFGTSSNAAVPIGLGYFFNNNDIIGVNYAYAQNSVNDKITYQQNEAGVWYSPSWMLGKYFVLIAQVDAHYVWGQKMGEVPATMGQLQDFDGYRLRAYPLFGVLLGGGWALKFKFGELSMLQTKTNNEGWTKSYVAGISGSTFGVGISKNFSFKK